MILHCKCHGFSGSCNIRTCWKTLPSFRVIGDRLKENFDSAIRVKVVMENTRGRKAGYLVRSWSSEKIKPEPRSLVYMNNSDSYCARNSRLKIPGTKGRICNITSCDLDGCDLMCCGRGYNTHNFTQVTQCNCKYQWCCELICKECVQNVITHTCK